MKIGVCPPEAGPPAAEKLFDNWLLKIDNLI
jgi:hypothetical protein